MAENNFRRFYRRNEFVSMITLQVDEEQLKAKLALLALTVPILDVRALDTGGAALEWGADVLPTEADFLLVDAEIAAFVGGVTTRDPVTVESLGVTQSTSAVLVRKAQIQTAPLEGGTYTFNWNSTIRMNPAGAASGVLATARITRSDGQVREQPDSWDLAAPGVHAFNGAIIFTVSAGQTLHAEIFVSRIGSAGIAEMLGVRLTIDQRAPAQA